MTSFFPTPICREAVRIFERKDHFIVVLFGASNTERYMPVLHWGDVLETGLRLKFGRKFHVINSGVCGNNTRDALARFNRDVSAFRPDAVIVTLGGNDCNPKPEKFVPDAEFSANLDEIVAKVRALGALPILQTYYKMDFSGMAPARAEDFLRKMELVRQTAERDKVFLVDQYNLFDRIPGETLRYKLLLNPMHVNELGNILIGVFLLRHFGIDAAEIRHNERLAPALELYRSISGVFPSA